MKVAERTRKDEREVERSVREQLFALKDQQYHDFHCKLMPTVNPDLVIGIRTPVLRKFAREYARTPDAAIYLSLLPHTYYEENNLHAFLLEGMKDYDECIRQMNRFLSYIDNWATCDCCAPRVFKKHLPEVLKEVYGWIASEKTYVIRYGIGTLMRYYLDEEFQPEYLTLVASVQSGEYYVNMMIAWYFATALAKQWKATIPYLEEEKLGDWVHNKTIQKSVESYRITKEQKVYLKTLKRKKHGVAGIAGFVVH